MKKALRITAFIAIPLVVLLAVGSLILRPKPLQTPDTVTDLAELETHLDRLAGFSPDSPPGLSLVVVQDGAIVYQKGFGLADGPRNIPATPDTVYNQWSMTKIVTAIAILQLYEQRLLDIDDPVVEHVPFFEVQYPSDASETITVRHLLNHSSGLSNNVPEVVGWVHTDGAPEWNQTDLIRRKLPDYAKLAYEPGSKAMYTNVGYMVLAAVIEAVSGQTYEQYVTEHILRSLGMTHTGFTYSESMIANEAAGSHPRADITTLLLPFLVDNVDALVRERRDGALWFNHIYSDQNGPTGLIGPPTDTARFLVAYLNGGELDGQRILSQATIDMMTHESHIKPGKTPETAGYDKVYHGLGWFFVPAGDSYYIGHSGGGPGFAASMRLYPDRNMGMVVMANGTYLDDKGILDLVASLDWR